MSFSNPRRSTKTTSQALTPTSSSASGRPTVNTAMSLRKGATFYSPTSPELPQFKVPALPRRSQTTLEDVVDAHKRRVALTLGDIDRSLSSLEDPSPTSRRSFRDEADPIPQGFLDHTLGPPSLRSYDSSMDSVMAQVSSNTDSTTRRSARLRHNRRPSRCSDSALGSSIETRPGKMAAENNTSSGRLATSAINMSAAAHPSTMQSLPRLSTRANNRIHEHILKPLLAKKSLKDFHDIVEACPSRIYKKEIVCLRDLEKTLMFMAPSKTKTVALYLDFCLTSIRCIQATVEYLSEREQTRPNDRPYTNGYFVDLVDQIKQYAQQIQAAKDKEAKGEQLDEMDFDPTDEVKLHGGLAKNGRPAELVRIKKNGKAISMATGEAVDIKEESKDAIRFKRSASEEAEEDEAALRSMARRKRSATAEPVVKRCREPGCEKEFKRPCDLTKHEKTHSRPWKCPVESCKYHEYGWPTEKEMDRHHNDKHSSAPALFKCKFQPCPYQSKRESNCKQHMEKAHGWTYIRSKNNGKNRDKASSVPSIVGGNLPTPASEIIRTPSSNGDPTGFEDLDEIMKMDAQPMPYALNFPEYNYAEANDIPQTINIDYSPVSEQTHNFNSSTEQSPFSEYLDISPANPTYFEEQFPLPGVSTNGLDFNLFEEEDLYAARAQIPTPQPEQLSAFLNPFPSSACSEAMPHFSPVGQGNAMLYTPQSLMDEGFEDFSPSCNMDGGDFQLFPNSTGGTVTSSAPSGLFGEINTPNALPNGMFDFDPTYPGTTSKQLLDFYNQRVNAALAQNNQIMNTNMNNNINAMDWSSDDYINFDRQ